MDVESIAVQSLEPAVLYSWSVAQPGDPAGWRAGGVSGSRDRAMLALCEALGDEPAGACGHVWRVSTALAGPVAYCYEGLVARARHDPATGRVVCAFPARRTPGPDWEDGALDG